MPITIDNLPPVSTIDPPDLLVVHNVATDRTKGISYQNLLTEITTDINAVTQSQLNTAIANVTAAFQAADLVVKDLVFHIGCRISVTSGPFLNNNPGTILGFGNWVEEQGNYYRGYTSNAIQGVIYDINTTYGSSEHNHGGTTGDTTLNSSQIPAHFHSYKDTYHTEASGYGSQYPAFDEYYESRGHDGIGAEGSDYDNSLFMYKNRNTSSVGGTLGHNHTMTHSQHLPPTRVERVWRRIS